MHLYVTYDEPADIVAVWFRDGAPDATSRDAGAGRFVEPDDEGPVSVEFLHASEGIDLSGIPYADQIERALGSLHAISGKVRGVPAS